MSEYEETYSVSDYIRPTKVKHEVIDKEGKEAVIIQALGFSIFQKKDKQGNNEGEPVKKPAVKVQFPSSNTYEYAIPKKIAAAWAEEVGSDDIRDLVGSKIKFQKETGANPWVSAILVELPKTKRKK